eukprot:1687074-Alexandrium_andersonii.AAC.1
MIGGALNKLEAVYDSGSVALKAHAQADNSSGNASYIDELKSRLALARLVLGKEGHVGGKQAREKLQKTSMRTSCCRWRTRRAC